MVKVNRRMSERRAELARAMPSEEEEDEVNRRTNERKSELARAIPSEEEEDEAKGMVRFQDWQCSRQTYCP